MKSTGAMGLGLFLVVAIVAVAMFYFFGFIVMIGIGILHTYFPALQAFGAHPSRMIMVGLGCVLGATTAFTAGVSLIKN